MLADNYDQHPYASLPIAKAHPARIEAIAALYGLPAPDCRTARVLEIGCASGGNLIPMAARMPDATFLGVDISSVQVDMAKARISRLGLGNIQVECRSLCDLGAADGRFDYIIAHGVLSWVPAEVATDLFRVIDVLLSPQGIAYVSYATLPGRAIQDSVAHLLRLHTATLPEADLEQARAALRFLGRYSASFTADRTSDVVALKAECDYMLNANDNILRHDYLAQALPFHFTDVVAMASANRLHYVTDAWWQRDLTENAPTGSIETMSRIPDRIHRQQWLDVLHMRHFRASLFQRADGLEPDDSISPHRLAGLWILPPVMERTRQPDGTMVLSWSGVSVKVENNLASVILTILAEARGVALSMADLIGCARTVLNEAAPNSSECLALIREMAVGGYFELLKHPQGQVSQSGDCPRVDPLNLDEAATQTWVTNHNHVPVMLAPERNFLLTKLDGQNRMNDLAAHLARTFPGGNASGRVRDHLEWFVNMSLLVD
jgi:SAM-dependent methyltransferase